MPTAIDSAAAGRGVSKLSKALSKLNLRSPTSETDSSEIHSFRTEQINLLKPLHSNAKNVLSHISIPSAVTKKRARDYIRSISITPKGKAFLPQCSEIIPGHLFISDHFTGTDAATLLSLGITHVISMQHHTSYDYPMLPTIDYCEVIVPMHAYEARRLVATIDDTVDFIDNALRQEGSRVLIHCRMGVDWSPSVIIAWFMRNGRCGYDEARDTVRRKRVVVAPGLDLVRGVKEWSALELARPLFPPGRGGRNQSSTCPSPLGSDLSSTDVSYQEKGEVLDIH
ncbi:phosphatases II [Ramaria rubella]|nr:phosphatases II [Ramaria rubella]